MKRFPIIAALVSLMAIVATSCNPTVDDKSYPKTLEGYWTSAPDAQNAWYSLEAGPAETMSARRRTSPAYIEDDLSAELVHHVDKTADTTLMSVVYEPSTGKGTLRSEGKVLHIEAQNDTTFTIQMVEGTVTFHRAVKPQVPDTPKPDQKPQKSDMEGFWAPASADDVETSSLLIYDVNDLGKAHATIFFNNEDINMGMSMELAEIDVENGKGLFTMTTDELIDTIPFSTDFKTITIVLEEDTAVLVKQAYVNSPLQNVAGTWKMLMMGIDVTLVADAQGLSTMSYAATYQGQQYEGSVNGQIYYSQKAGRGAFEITDDNEQLQEMGMYAGVSVPFEAVTATQVKIPYGKMSFVFNKQ